MQDKTIPAWTSKVLLQPRLLMSDSVRGANMKVPIPEPQTPIPVARGRHFSK